jgi:muconolactone delta-isomerase
MNMNEERLKRLKELLYEGNMREFNRLAYEWVKTGVFTRADLANILAMIYEFAYNNGRSDESEGEITVEGA